MMDLPPRAAKLPLFISGAAQRKFWWLVNLKGNLGHTDFKKKLEQYTYLSYNNSFQTALKEINLNPNQTNEMKFDWKNFQRSLISFGNTLVYIQSNKWKEVFGDFPEIINFLWKYFISNKWKEIFRGFPAQINNICKFWQSNFISIVLLEWKFYWKW